jgi:hypothetical protein
MVSKNWDTLKMEIRTYWMNQEWVEKMRLRASSMYYRESGHEKETPTQYYIRKQGLTSIVHDYTAQHAISEIMTNAPVMWSVAVNTTLFTRLEHLQQALKAKEDLLIRLADQAGWGRAGSRNDGSTLSSEQATRFGRPKRPVSNEPRSSNPSDPKTSSKKERRERRRKNRNAVRVLAVQANNRIGWDQFKAPHPKDDSNVSKGRTPEGWGARGCIKCGSKKHWDKDCKYWDKEKDGKRVRTRFAEASAEVLMAEAAYEKAFENHEDDEETLVGSGGEEADNGDNGDLLDLDSETDVENSTPGF